MIIRFSIDIFLSHMIYQLVSFIINGNINNNI